MIRKTPLNALKYFYYVAHYGSVTKASNTLNVTQSAVSKQVKSLENLLEVELFNRVNNHLVLTTKGKELYETCHNVFAKLDDTLVSLNNQVTNINKPLVLSCESTLSMRWLIPRLAKFKASKNGFDVVLLTACGAIDFHKTGVDIALRRNNFDWDEHIHHEKIVDEYIMVAQSTVYTNKKTILLSMSRPKLWKKLKQTGLLNNQFNQYKRMELEHFYLCIEGCLAGLGATTASIYMLEKDLNYQLLEPISPLIADGSAYYLLSAEPFHRDERKVIFKDWLIEEMGRTKEQFIEGFYNK